MAQPIDILLVVDDPADAELTLRALSRSGLEPTVEHAPDAEEALDALERRGRRAPRGDLLRRLRAADGTRTLPVVVFTSSAEPRDLTGSYGAGANAYAQKPVNFDDFGETLRRVCQFWLAVNRAPEPPA